MAVVRTPKFFTHNSIVEFLNQAHVIFSKVNKRETGFELNFGKTRKISIVGVLLVYKFMDFTFQNRCFSDPTIFAADEGEFARAQERYKFRPLIDALREPKERKSKWSGIWSGKSALQEAYENLDVYVGDSNKFLIAPQPIFRDGSWTKEALRNEFASAVAKFYDNAGVSEMILSCITEVALNFWLHAFDEQSIIVAEGTLSKVEISCADTGRGIISTMREGLPDLARMTDVGVLLEAVKENVSSKVNSDHLGSGLFIIDKMAKLTGGILHIYSEGVFYQRSPGRVITGKCGYWKGTILYLNLPLNKVFGMSDIFQHHAVKLNKIGLKFV